MAASIKAFAALSGELSPDERKLLSTAYKNVVGARRSAWRLVTTIETNCQIRSDDKMGKEAAEYRAKIESELNAICKEVLV